MQIAILLYLYHLDLWDEYKNLILKNCDNYTLFLGLCRDNDNQRVINDCKKNFKNCEIQIFENKGVDIGPFLKQLEIVDENKYPFFIKVHGKKSILSNKLYLNWRVNLLDSLIGSKFTFNKNLELIKNKNIGCVFNKSYLNKNQSNLTFKIKEILNILGLEYKKLSGSDYMMGSIYLSKTSLFKKYFTSEFISKIYDKLESYGPIPDNGSYNHAMEIISGYIIKEEKLKIVDGIVKSKIIYNPISSNNKLHLINLYNGEYTIKENIKTRGVLKNNKIFWINADAEQEYKVISKNKISKKEDNFDKMMYKILNKNLNINLSEAKDHYLKIGKKEGAITKEDIKKVFDENFYKNLYGIKKNKYQEILQDYIIKGICGSRLYNHLIIEDNFDYGFYQSYNNIFNENITYNQYTSLYDYILTKKKCNNKLHYKKFYGKIKSLCIYYCEIKNKKDLYFLKTNISMLEKNFDKICVIYYCEKNIKFSPDKDTASYIKSLSKIKYKEYINYLISNDVKDYNCVCLIDNSNIIIKKLNKFLYNFLQTDCLLYSFTDCYIKNYHIDDSVLVFRGENKNKIIEYLSISKDKTELSKNIIKDEHTIGSFFQINQEKELFWKNLFIDIRYFPSILIKNNVPFISRDNVDYLLKLIPRNFKKIKNTGKIQSFFDINLDKNNLKKIFNINISDKKFCLVLHIHDLNNIKEYESFIDSLKSKINLKIYLTTNSKNKKGFIKNKGMDIGPFIKSISEIKEDYDYIIKLHSKNLRSFRNLCFNNIINQIYHHILLLEDDEKSFCSGPNFYNIKMDNINDQKIKEFLIRNNIKIEKTIENNFFAGTMFIAKYKILKEFISLINIEEEYNILENGSVLNTEETNTHAWERILTNIVPNYYGMKNKSI